MTTEFCDIHAKWRQGGRLKIYFHAKEVHLAEFHSLAVYQGHFPLPPLPPPGIPSISITFTMIPNRTFHVDTPGENDLITALQLWLF